MTTSESSNAATTYARYIFTDIVSFTKDRSVEAQSDLVAYLNDLVTKALSDHSIEEGNRILLPTGDGICIAIIDPSPQFDVHLQLSRSLLARLEEHNHITEDSMRKFRLRIGLNENIDNLVTDINGRINLAGSGINMAQRIMGQADGNQIMVAQSVYDKLHVRESYLKSFRNYSGRAKHGINFTVYQYIEEDASWLNSRVPSLFAPKEKELVTLTKLVAYYIALSAKHEEFLLSRKTDASFEYNAIVWLYFLARDYLGRSEASRFDTWRPHVFGGMDRPPEEQYEHYDGQDFWVMLELAEHLDASYLMKFRSCFEGMTCIFASEEGRARLREEWPEIEKEVCE